MTMNLGAGLCRPCLLIGLRVPPVAIIIHYKDGIEEKFNWSTLCQSCVDDPHVIAQQHAYDGEEFEIRFFDT